MFHHHKTFVVIQVVNRALDIIELIASSGRHDVPLKEISDSLELNPGTCANIIKTLVDRDYLEKSPNKGKGYGLGSMIYFITGSFSYSIDLISAAKAPMHALTDTINECCMIGIMRNDIRISLYEVHAKQDLRVVGKKEKPAYQTASGRMLMAHLSTEKIRQFINKYGLPDKEVWEDVQLEKDLLFELEKIRRKGYAIQVAQSKILGVAVPILKEGQVVASLGVFLPEFRFNDTTKEKILAELHKAASDTNLNLTRALT